MIMLKVVTNAHHSDEVETEIISHSDNHSEALRHLRDHLSSRATQEYADGVMAWFNRATHGGSWYQQNNGTYGIDTYFWTSH